MLERFREWRPIGICLPHGPRPMRHGMGEGMQIYLPPHLLSNGLWGCVSSNLLQNLGQGWICLYFRWEGWVINSILIPKTGSSTLDVSCPFIQSPFMKQCSREWINSGEKMLWAIFWYPLQLLSVLMIFKTYHRHPFPKFLQINLKLLFFDGYVEMSVWDPYNPCHFTF